MLRGVVLVLVLLAVPAFSGCSDFVDQLNRPDYHVRVTPLVEGGWNHENRFEVQVTEDQPVHIEASSTDGRFVQADGQRGAILEIPDGTWDISYTIGGHKWNSYSGIRVDATPPRITGLELVGKADASGHYRLGVGASVTGATSVRVVDLADDTLVGTALPVDVNNLGNALHAFLVSAIDEAGNYGNATVQVLAGNALDLPDGKFTFGVVARYSNTVRLWDITNPASYVTVAQASQQTGGHYLGDGYGIVTDDPAVQQVVARAVTPGMTTTQRAMAILKDMMQTLRYDTSRLDNDHLLTPHQVLLDTEDSQGRDCTDPTGKAADCDGMVMDGSGNGVRGGICRDLAATYVSILRSAGVPARLVSGYVAGNVNGFHAWVEYYGGVPAGHSEQSPWIPVDVSIVDGTYNDGVLLQAFGIQLPDYLTLRTVPEASEVRGWSTALGVRYQYPDSSQDPDITFEKSVAPTFTTTGVLCFNQETRARATADSKNGCGGFGQYLDHFTLATTRVIDYGILVRQATPGTKVKAEVGYPFPDSVTPNQVDFKFYGEPFTLDAAAGKALSDFTVS